MQQAQRIADKTVFMNLGEVIKEGETTQIFSSPKNDTSKSYIGGQF
jgi:phosphate transport system ATP-binding protein